MWNFPIKSYLPFPTETRRNCFCGGTTVSSPHCALTTIGSPSPREWLWTSTVTFSCDECVFATSNNQRPICELNKKTAMNDIRKRSDFSVFLMVDFLSAGYYGSLKLSMIFVHLYQFKNCLVWGKKWILTSEKYVTANLKDVILSEHLPWLNLEL